jgi:hypothetical protein
MPAALQGHGPESSIVASPLSEFGLGCSSDWRYLVNQSLGRSGR